MCRVAVLYLHGGYSFDTDLKVVGSDPSDNPYTLDSAVSFAAVRTAGGTFNPSFLASAPEHPIIKAALHKMLDYFQIKYGAIPETRETKDPMGASTLTDAFAAVSEADRGEMVLLEEVRCALRSRRSALYGVWGQLTPSSDVHSDGEARYPDLTEWKQRSFVSTRNWSHCMILVINREIEPNLLTM
jgi:hypothetical protein